MSDGQLIPSSITGKGAFYAGSVLDHLPEHYKSRYFERADHGLRVHKQLRQLEEAFLKEGGLRGRMTRARLAERAREQCP